MKTNILKLLFLAAPIVLGFACSSDDDSDDTMIGKWPPIVFEYDGNLLKSHSTIQVPNTGGVYKVKCTNYRPWICEYLVKSDTTAEGLCYHTFGKKTEDGIEISRFSSDTLCPATREGELCEWFWTVREAKGKEYSVIVSENNGPARSVHITFEDGDAFGYLTFVQEGK